MALDLTRAQVDEMIAHAHAEFPSECCGLIAGNGSRVEAIFRCQNEHSSPYTYLIGPRDYDRVQKEVDGRGLDIIGYYHSHGSTQAYPSPTDIAQSKVHPSAIYAIVSLRNKEMPEVRAFRIVGQRQILEEDLTVR
jgi:proteasome lid subunit RPN8/RPN11